MALGEPDNEEGQLRQLDIATIRFDFNTVQRMKTMYSNESVDVDRRSMSHSIASSSRSNPLTASSQSSKRNSGPPDTSVPTPPVNIDAGSARSTIKRNGKMAGSVRSNGTSASDQNPNMPKSLAELFQPASASNAHAGSSEPELITLSSHAKPLPANSGSVNNRLSSTTSNTSAASVRGPLPSTNPVPASRNQSASNSVGSSGNVSTNSLRHLPWNANAPGGSENDSVEIDGGFPGNSPLVFTAGKGDNRPSSSSQAKRGAQPKRAPAELPATGNGFSRFVRNVVRQLGSEDDQQQRLRNVRVDRLPAKFLAKYLGARICQNAEDPTSVPTEVLVEEAAKLHDNQDLTLVLLNVSDEGLQMTEHPRNTGPHLQNPFLYPTDFISAAVQVSA